MSIKVGYALLDCANNHRKIFYIKVLTNFVFTVFFMPAEKDRFEKP